MTVTTIYGRSNPSMGGLTFDCVFSESASAGYESTDYSVEDGAIYQDHIRKLPKMITMRVGVSDTPFKGVLGRILATGAGAALGALPPIVSGAVSVGGQLYNAANGSGSPDTRSAKAWQEIVKAADSLATFDVVTIKGMYKNFHIKNISYECTEENENSIDIIIEMKEIRQFQSGIESGQPTKSQLRDGTSESIQAAPPANAGGLALEPV